MFAGTRGVSLHPESTPCSHPGSRIALLSVAVSAVMLFGCAVGPDFERPAPPTVDGFLLERQASVAGTADGATQRYNRKKDVPGDWWKLFGSNGLRALIDEALKNNPDLQAAQAALRMARENTAAQRGAWFPQVDGNFSATRQKDPNDITGMAPNPQIFN